MRHLIFAIALGASASVAIVSPAIAQNRAAEARFESAQQRFDRELSLYRSEVDRYRGARVANGRYSNDYRDSSYNDPRYNDPNYSDDRDESGYDASRYYRDGSGYNERTLSSNDRVYRGSDGRYYCKRSDGTTGLVVGAAAGGILGNVIDGGHSRTVGTLLGGAAGALAGRAIERDSSVRCR